MNKYAKIINEELGLCEVGLYDNIEFYQSIGMRELDVQQSDIDNNWYLKDKCPTKTEKQKEQEEKERISGLYLTRADVERGIYKAKGLDFEDIIELVKDNPEIDLKALKIELKANNFYRGNPYVCAIGKILGFSEKQLDEFFENGDYRVLLDDTRALKH